MAPLISRITTSSFHILFETKLCIVTNVLEGLSHYDMVVLYCYWLFKGVTSLQVAKNLS